MQRRWSWFVVRSHYGETVLAAQNVSKMGIETYVPLIKNETGRRIIPMFDEYFFARWSSTWANARYARGVADLVYGAGRELGFIEGSFIKTLRSLENKRGVIELDTAPPPATFCDGDDVVSRLGSFYGTRGRVQGSQDGHFVSVLFSLIGRDVAVMHNVSDLESAVLTQ